MRQKPRSRRLLIACLAAGVVAVMGLAGGTAAAEPLFPSPPPPVPNPASGAMVTPNAVGTGPSAVAPPATSPAVPAAAPTTAAGVPGAQPVPAALVPATSGTLRDYFAAKSVTLEPQKPQGFTALDVTLPVPTGWTQVPDPNVVDAFVVIADRHADALYTPNAQVVVYRLIGDFDPNEAITHGFVDSQKQLGWRATNAALTPFDGFPSSIIEGTYRENDMTLNTSRRHVIATSGPDRYLVSLAVTTAAVRAIGSAPATDAIVNGFHVALPNSAHAPAPPPGPAPRPGSTTTPPQAARPGLAG